MPRHCYPGAPYGCGHTHEHSEAAKKGWLTRRGLSPASRERARFARAEADLSIAHGEAVTKLHTHKEHPNEVRFQMGGQWYRMSRGEFRDLERWAAGARKEMEADLKRAEKDSAKREKAEAKYKSQMERYAQAEQAALDASVRKRLRGGGIRPSSVTRYVRKRNRIVPVDYGEWETLPKDLRKRSGRYTLDEVRHVLYEEGAISAEQFDAFTVRDVVDHIEMMQTRTKHARAIRRKAGMAA